MQYCGDGDGDSSTKMHAKRVKDKWKKKKVIEKKKKIKKLNFACWAHAADDISISRERE